VVSLRKTQPGVNGHLRSPEWTETEAYTKLKQLGYGMSVAKEKATAAQLDPRSKPAAHGICISGAVRQVVRGDAYLARLLGLIDSWYVAESRVGLAIDKDQARAIHTTETQLAFETGLSWNTIHRLLPKLVRADHVRIEEEPGVKGIFIEPRLRIPGEYFPPQIHFIPDIVFLICDRKAAPAWLFSQLLFKMDIAPDGTFRAGHTIKGRRCCYNSWNDWSMELGMSRQSVDRCLTWLMNEKHFIVDKIGVHPKYARSVTFYALEHEPILAALNAVEEKCRGYVKRRAGIFCKKLPQQSFDEPWRGAPGILASHKQVRWYCPTPQEINRMRLPSNYNPQNEADQINDGLAMLAHAAGFDL
jgi:hypothetical protein